MKIVLLLITILIGLSAFSIAYAEACTKENIIGSWRETGDNKASWEFKENGTITCLRKCNYGDMPQAYEVNPGTIKIAELPLTQDI